jgi:RNA polymerase sigma-70 factor (ECF subfamily)
MEVPSNDFDDLVQNVLLRLWKSLASYDPGKGRFRTWLGIVVRNAVVDHFAETRRRGKLMEQGQAFFQMLNETPSSEIEQRIESEWVRYVTDLALERIRKVFSGEAVAVFTMSLNEKPAKEIAEEKSPRKRLPRN